MSLRGDIKRLEGELREAETALPGDFREVYQRVVKAKGPDAMAAVEGGSCGGCYQQLTINIVNEINMGRVVLCKSCGRVLYLPEDKRPGRSLRFVGLCWPGFVFTAVNFVAHNNCIGLA